MEIHAQFFLLGNIYGHNSDMANSQLLNEIKNTIDTLISRYPTAKIVLGGDFNMVWSPERDRFPPKAEADGNILIHFCNRLNLIDI